MSSGRSRRGQTLTASEVGRYVYCARAWWLQRVAGHAPENVAALEAGLRRHGAHGADGRASARLSVWAWRWALVAVVLVMALLVTLIRGA